VPKISINDPKYYVGNESLVANDSLRMISPQRDGHMTVAMINNELKREGGDKPRNSHVINDLQIDITDQAHQQVRVETERKQLTNRNDAESYVSGLFNKFSNGSENASGSRVRTPMRVNFREEYKESPAKAAYTRKQTPKYISQSFNNNTNKNYQDAHYYVKELFTRVRQDNDLDEEKSSQ